MQPEIHFLGLPIKTFGLAFGLSFVAVGLVLAKRLKELGKPVDWAYEMVFAALATVVVARLAAPGAQGLAPEAACVSEPRAGTEAEAPLVRPWKWRGNSSPRVCCPASRLLISTTTSGRNSISIREPKVPS